MQKPHPEREAGLQVAELSSLEGILCAHALRCWHWAPGEGFGPVFASCEYLSTLASVPDPGAPLGEHKACLSGALQRLSSLPSEAAPALSSIQPDCSEPTESPRPRPTAPEWQRSLSGDKECHLSSFPDRLWAGLEGPKAVN